MTRLIEYIRQTPRDEGTHGILQPGQVLEVNEDQYQSALDSDSFRALACEGDAALTSGDATDFPVPGPTPFYDLSRFAWHKPRVRERLRRLPLRRILEIAKAVQHLTGQDLAYGPGVNRWVTVDEIVTIAITFRWTSPARRVGGVTVA
jgi:hypothetical protein